MGEPAAWRFEGLLESFEAADEDSFRTILSRLELAGGWTVVALNYELGYLFEPVAAPPDWSPGRQPLARFWRFTRRVELSADGADAWLSAQVGDQPAGIGGLRPCMTKADYLAAVDRIKGLISAGDCYQVNLTFPLDFEWFGLPLALYARLRQAQPVRYGGFIGNAAQGLVSLSPELFIERQGERLVTRPMKGTADRQLPAERLRQSAKDCAENLMIVDLLRNDLGRVAENGSVAVDRLFDIEAYPTVWQMVSEISAKVVDKSLADILRAMFPCGSITGAPKVRAMQIAADLEQGERGSYTGAIGWLAPNGDFRLNVAIRTLDLAADGGGRLGVGSGVVADSQAEAEWQECLLKARFLADSDPGIVLIETLRRENGVYPRLAGHLARLQQSAAWFGFQCDLASIEQKLAALPGDGTWRVRLTLSKQGEANVACFSLGDEVPGPRYAILSDAAIRAENPMRRHKTSDRALYDAALKGIAENPLLFDIVFLNERGEVAEGARSNIFVERDGMLLTPPVESGALPGVLRAELLASGRAKAAVLRPEDLANGFWMGNALRGLIPVTLQARPEAA